MHDTQFSDFDVDEEVRKLNEEIARSQQRRKAKPLPKPDPAPEPATWARVEKHVHDGLLCFYALCAAGFVGALFFGAFVIGTRFV